MGKKILLADDSITIQKVIELTFSDEDFEVTTVGNGRLAIEKAEELLPDLVLCDIIMPEKDGYEVCDFIKKDPSLSHIPVLLLTGAFEPFDQERAARVGCDGFLAKPFEPQTLIAKVKELLARAGSRPAPPAPAPAMAAAAPAWSTAMPSPPPAPAPAPVAAAPPAPAPEPEAEPDDFAPGAVFGSAPMDIAGYESGEDVGTLRSPAYRGTDDEKPAAPASLDELYDDDPYGAPDDLMPLSEGEAESVAPPPDEEPEPWAQPTVEVPLETRAKASVESAQLASDGFEEVFEDEARASAAAAPAPPAPPAPASAPLPPIVEPDPAPPASARSFGFPRLEEAPPSSPSEPPPPAASVPAPAPAPPAAKSADTTAFVSPGSSFRDVVPAEEEEEDKTSITRSVAGEVQVPVDMVEKIAQRVVAQISEKVIREIAWEVIPDLAEALIKREIDRLKAELQQT
jgi:CheY-like chemotaxis protein